MNKIEQLHLQAIESEVIPSTMAFDEPYVAYTNEAAEKCSEISKNISIEFAQWLRYDVYEKENDPVNWENLWEQFLISKK